MIKYGIHIQKDLRNKFIPNPIPSDGKEVLENQINIRETKIN